MKDYIWKLGRIIANIQIIETNIRLSLMYLRGQGILAPNKWMVGQEQDVNALNGYESLGQLIDELNSNAHLDSSRLKIDRKIVEIRDLIAHGRMSSFSSVSPMYLYKFDKPNKATGKTKLIAYQEVSPRFMDESLDFVIIQSDIVHRIMDTAWVHHKNCVGIV